MLNYAKKNSESIDALLFYKVDRAARNMKDWIELLDLRDRYNIKVICITEPFDETPAGKLNANMLAAISQFYSDQLSKRTQEGVEHRVKSGLFPGHAPYGYENFRENGRGLIRINKREADNVHRVFELYAFYDHTLDSLLQKVKNEGLIYKPYQSSFPRSKLQKMLTDRSYLGEINHKGQWHQGTHKPIITADVFQRVQVLLGTKTYSHHESVYGSAMVTCEHCGRPLVCEIKSKRTKSGERKYRYYRCTQYTSKGHPRKRVNENKFDEAVISTFKKMEVNDPKIHKWIERVIREKTKTELEMNSKQLADIQRQITKIDKDRNCLLTLRMHEEIDADSFAKKDMELRDKLSLLKLQIEGQGRQKSEIADLALKVFELSQTLVNKWYTAGIDEKRRILNILCLNLTFNGVSLDISLRKPFDILSKGFDMVNGAGGGI